MSNEPTEQPVMALLLTEHQAGILNAALSHYRGHLRRHTPIWPDGDEMQRAAPDLEELQRYLVEEARTPMVPKVDVEIIAKLAELNQARQQVSTAERGSETWQRASEMFIMARTWLVAEHCIPVYSSDKDEKWHFGCKDPLKAGEKPPGDEEWKSAY